KAALMLGAGRETQKSVIDLSVGIVLHKKIGDKVEQGETLLTIHANKSSIDAIKDKLYQHINISNKEIPQPTLIHNTILFMKFSTDVLYSYIFKSHYLGFDLNNGFSFLLKYKL